MARFEQRITESEVSAAREAIAAGASLRSVAAKIPCAPSTLSVRLKKAMADKADSEVVVRTNGSGEDAGQTAAEPLEILRSAVLATKTNGEPHWPTRLAAVRMLATLRPEEFEGSKREQRTEPEIVVFDLEPVQYLSCIVLANRTKPPSVPRMLIRLCMRPPHRFTSSCTRPPMEKVSLLGRGLLPSLTMRSRSSWSSTGPITPRKPSAGAPNSPPAPSRPASRTLLKFHQPPR